jgi:hypothetical protein
LKNICGLVTTKRRFSGFFWWLTTVFAKRWFC